MRIRDVIVKETRTIAADMNVKDALELLFKHEISGLPVVDNENKLVGMFTEKDILSYVLPSYIEKVGKFIYEEDPKSMRKKFQDLSNVKVSQLMRKSVVTTTEDTNLSEAARIMLTQKARRLPVVDKSGKLVGIVARVDILKAMAKASSI
ncbi:MAG: CBS domain-containing protein [Candidatus Omnitrophota bacterium]